MMDIQTGKIGKIGSILIAKTKLNEHHTVKMVPSLLQYYSVQPTDGASNHTLHTNSNNVNHQSTD